MPNDNNQGDNNAQGEDRKNSTIGITEKMVPGTVFKSRQTHE